jgi:hypothetical protein
LSNLPILYFTLGAEVGLPLGYFVAWCWYELIQPLLHALASVYWIERRLLVLIAQVDALRAEREWA